MPSTYSTNLKITLMATGENNGTWGDETNNNLGTLLEQAIVGYGTVAMADANQTISILDGVTSTARMFVLECTGVLTATRILTVPTIYKNYIVYNNTSGGFAITVKTTAGTGVSVGAGLKRFLIVDNVNVVEAITSTGALTVAGAATLNSTLAVTGAVSLTVPLGTASGGTGTSSSTGTGALVLQNTPTLITPVLGVATATSVNKVALTPPATSAILTIADGKTLTANNSLTLAGTDSTTMTFPNTSGTVVTLDATQTLTNKTLTNAALGSSTATTQSAGDNSTKVATTAYVDASLPSSVGFRANTNGVGAPGALAKITLSAATFNVGGYWNNGTQRFTPPAGLYAFQIGLTCAISNSYIEVFLYKNGVAIAHAYQGNSQTWQLNTGISITDQANGTDYYEAYWAGGAIAVPPAADAWFSAMGTV